MKKLLSIIALCAMALSASAQIVSSSSRSITRETPDYPNYNRIYASYNSQTFKTDGYSGEAMSGFRAGWLGGWNIVKSIPLYLEAGANIQGNFKSESESYSGYTEKGSVTLIKLNLPVNVAYRFTIPNTSIAIAPHLGFHLNGNIIGQNKATASYKGESKSITESHFSKDDMEGSEYTANRVQFGGQVGAGVVFKKFYLGFEYAASFTDYFKKNKASNWSATIGFEF